MLNHQQALPPRLHNVAPRMIAQNWLLGSYRDFAILERALQGIQSRLLRPQLMDGMMPLLEQLYEPLRQDFHQLYPPLINFALQHRYAPD